jgi:hypothetical protein
VTPQDISDNAPNRCLLVLSSTGIPQVLSDVVRETRTTLACCSPEVRVFKYVSDLILTLKSRAKLTTCVEKLGSTCMSLSEIAMITIKTPTDDSLRVLHSVVAQCHMDISAIHVFLAELSPLPHACAEASGAIRERTVAHTALLSACVSGCVPPDLDSSADSADLLASIQDIMDGIEEVLRLHKGHQVSDLPKAVQYLQSGHRLLYQQARLMAGMMTTTMGQCAITMQVINLSRMLLRFIASVSGDHNKVIASYSNRCQY